ncbi:hypothetical protein TanjilG_08031 [Lupinus angustifolius]|uniref:Josephin-like protein n=1 Tax=Lupinus angustifolius TaxID=3871 RepID=A0A4P1RM82_LUPAN|nr:hypothetical protein TanjilG_08031 [Lupinus angustifolius]
MFRKGKRICYSPYINEKPTIFLNGRELGNMKKIIGNQTKETGVVMSPMKFLIRLGAKVASAVRVVTMRRRSCRKISSSTLPKSRSFSDPNDSYRARAVQDCIEFLHSSSTRERPS